MLLNINITKGQQNNKIIAEELKMLNFLDKSLILYN